MKLGVVILAAGNSSRFGECKFILKYKNNKTVIQHIIDTFQNINDIEIIVVTQEKHLKIMNKSVSKNVKFILNNNPEKERFYSLQLGLEYLKNVDYCFIHNADTPEIDINTLKLIEEQKNKYVTIPTYQNKKGHPILISNFVIQNILKQNHEVKLNEFLYNFEKKYVNVSNEGVLEDIDFQNDYNEMIKKYAVDL